jgi:hypothetical protein
MEPVHGPLGFGLPFGGRYPRARPGGDKGEVPMSAGQVVEVGPFQRRKLLQDRNGLADGRDRSTGLASLQVDRSDMVKYYRQTALKNKGTGVGVDQLLVD